VSRNSIKSITANFRCYHSPINGTSNVSKLDKGKKNPEIGLVKTPFELPGNWFTKDTCNRSPKAVDSAKVMMDLAEYHPLGSALGMLTAFRIISAKTETRGPVLQKNQWSPMRWQNLKKHKKRHQATA